MERLPLFGQRILDLAKGPIGRPTLGPGAGPYATRLLADMGAEVIKVEAPDNGGLPRSDSFNHVNRNKYACTLDLGQPRGRELFLRLVALSDVLIEDSLKDLGLSYDALRSARADIIVASLSSHGRSGPEKDSVADGTDIAAGVAAAGAVALALWHRRRTGEGQRVDVTGWESMAGLIGEYVVGYSMNRRLPQPMGNRHSSMAPHGCYPCAGAARSADLRPDDQWAPPVWVTIAVEGDEQFAALCRAMGHPELTADTHFADVVSRYRNQEELDRIVGGWTRQLAPQAATEALQAAGIAASPVLSVLALYDDPHLRARGFWESVSHPDAGTWDLDGVPWRLSRSPAHIRLPAPILGEHNHYVLRGLLGLSEAEVRELGDAGVIRGGPAHGSTGSP
jgi:benzylsuccinate CoA-transferase BbsF subunit